MKRKHIAVEMSLAICFVTVLLLCVVLGVNNLLTKLMENTNIVCKGEVFSTVEEALQAMEASAREANDPSLDYCPPYELVYTFDYEENTIMFYSYCYSFDGERSESYEVRILKHNGDGTLSFDTGLASFYLKEHDGNEYYYFTNIKTKKGEKSISLLYLDKDSDKDIYVDGIKAEKMLVSIDNHEFYLCYAISNRDTFLSNLMTPILYRHKIEMK